jgi:hypothetical protein
MSGHTLGCHGPLRKHHVAVASDIPSEARLKRKPNAGIGLGKSTDGACIINTGAFMACFLATPKSDRAKSSVHDDTGRPLVLKRCCRRQIRLSPWRASNKASPSRRSVAPRSSICTGRRGSDLLRWNAFPQSSTACCRTSTSSSDLRSFGMQAHSPSTLMLGCGHHGRPISRPRPSELTDALSLLRHRAKADVALQLTRG